MCCWPCHMTLCKAEWFCFLMKRSMNKWRLNSWRQTSPVISMLFTYTTITTDVRTSAVSCLCIFPAPVHCFYSYLQWVCVPFVVTNPATSNITDAALTSLYQEPWMGKLEPEDIGTWMDELLFLVRKKQKGVGGRVTIYNTGLILGAQLNAAALQRESILTTT